MRDDEIWVYHNAVRFRGVPESYAPQYREYFNDLGALELARLRLDGFVSMDADGAGSIVTGPMEARGQQLYVNAQVAGGVRAAVLDAETKEPLPGFTASECEPLTGDQLAGGLAWPQGPIDADRPVRMRFELANAKLYAFWLANEPVLPMLRPLNPSGPSGEGCIEGPDQADAGGANSDSYPDLSGLSEEPQLNWKECGSQFL